ncbi:hypothetical protein ACP4OV_015124 [Aristida adscensionis]
MGDAPAHPGNHVNTDQLQEIINQNQAALANGVPLLVVGGNDHQQLMVVAMNGSQVLVHHTVNNQAKQQEPSVADLIKEYRGWLSAVAAVIASVTYQAGLNPPGGAGATGAPVLLSKSPLRFYVFSIANAAAFACSLFVLFWVGNYSLGRHIEKASEKNNGLLFRVSKWIEQSTSVAVALVLDMLSLVVSYVVGSTGQCIWLSAIVAGVLLLAIAWYVVLGIEYICHRVKGYIKNAVNCILGPASAQISSRQQELQP